MHVIKFEAENLKLIKHPKRELKALASSKIEKDYASLFPQESKKDILYVSLVSHTINNINKNDCIILSEEGLSTYKTAIDKPLNIEHQGKDIVGFCVNSFLGNMKNNKILSEDEAQEIVENNGMVNVGNIFAIWKINNPELIDILNENFDENSENFNKIKASFEYYFEDFDFYVSDGATSNFPNGKIIPNNNEESEQMFASLRMNGGNGKWNGNRISIAPKNGFIGGVGLVINPANHFSDITAKKDGGDLTIIIDEDTAMEDVLKSDIKDIKSVNINIGENMDKILEEQKPVVDSTEAISTENVEQPQLKTEAAVPVSIDSDMAKKLQEQLDSKIAEIESRDNKVKDLENTISELRASLDAAKLESQKISEIAQKVQLQLDAEISARKAIEEKEQERKKLELIASRMEILTEFIEVNESNKDILSSECECSEEEFGKKLDFYRSISKKIVASEETKSEVESEVKEVVEKTVSDTAKDTKSVNIVTANPPTSLVEQFSKAFKVKDFGYKS